MRSLGGPFALPSPYSRTAGPEFDNSSQKIFLSRFSRPDPVNRYCRVPDLIYRVVAIRVVGILALKNTRGPGCLVCKNYKGDLCVGGPESVRQQPITRAHVWRSLGDYNLMPKLGVVKAPVLVIHGAADVIPLKSSEFWAFGYPNARLLVIEKAGHIGQIEAPEIFFPAIDAFLKGSFPAAAKTIKQP